MDSTILMSNSRQTLKSGPALNHCCRRLMHRAYPVMEALERSHGVWAEVVWLIAFYSCLQAGERWTNAGYRQ